MAIPASLENLYAESARIAACRLAARTHTEYATDWSLFEAWCERTGRAALPASADTVILFLTDHIRSGFKVSTARRRVSAIMDRHRSAGLAIAGRERIKGFLEAAQREHRERPEQKRPLSLTDLRAICQRLASSSGALEVRDRAVITIGFASALRRSNLVALDLVDVRFMARGVVLRVRYEKQDQQGVGRLIGIARGVEPTCPVIALEAWLEVRGILPGPLFTRIYRGKASLRRLNPKRVAIIVKKAVRLIGLDPAPYSGHSLRAGFVTAAIEAGVGEFVIAAQTGHRSLASLRLYFRSADPFRGANASAMIGL